MWHVVQISDALDREFTAALGTHVPTLGWAPSMSLVGAFRRAETDEFVADPPLRVRHFPLQRGYQRFPISLFAQAADRQLARLKRFSQDPATSTLICTTPYWAPLAELWPGPVVYYLTDLMAAYKGADPSLVRSLDQRMCAAATLVCPNSQRIADYLMRDCGCLGSRIQIIPNATRLANVYEVAPEGPASLPADVADLRRPVAGVIGNLASNMDWLLLEETIQHTPEFSWVLVGPVTMPIGNAEQRRARQAVQSMENRVRFVGRKHYGELRDYARSFDVAVLPYFRREPTYSGSSTRFYEHLAACRPMLATHGFHELLSRQPLLRLVNSPDELVAGLESLRSVGFDDGLTEERWLASQNATWEQRSLMVVQSLGRKLDRSSLAVDQPVRSTAASQSRAAV